MIDREAAFVYGLLVFLAVIAIFGYSHNFPSVYRKVRRFCIEPPPAEMFVGSIVVNFARFAFRVTCVLALLVAVFGAEAFLIIRFPIAGGLVLVAGVIWTFASDWKSSRELYRSDDV